MTDAQRASQAMSEASYLAAHSDDTLPQMATKVVRPLAARAERVADGVAYVFADGTVLYVTDSDGGSFESLAELERQLGVERAALGAAYGHLGRAGG